jgi:hypothetical protein
MLPIAIALAPGLGSSVALVVSLTRGRETKSRKGAKLFRKKNALAVWSTGIVSAWNILG